MPSITLGYAPQGPVIDVLVGITSAREMVLQQHGQAIPTFVQTRMLIDSGASNSCVDPTVLQSLQLTPTGVTSVHTPSTNGVAIQVAQYDVRLLVMKSGPVPNFRFFDALPVSECNLLAQGIQGLLGRDVLQHCVLYLNGEMNLFTLSF
jgi:hypothetical protein